MEAEDGGRYEDLAGTALARRSVHLASFCKKPPLPAMSALPERLETLDQLVGRAFVVPRGALFTFFSMLLR